MEDKKKIDSIKTNIKKHDAKDSNFIEKKKSSFSKKKKLKNMLQLELLM